MITTMSIVKYLLEGAGVAIAAYVIPTHKFPSNVDSLIVVLIIGLTATMVFAVLDIFAPVIGQSSRRGAGFGIGMNTVGWGLEGFNTDPSIPGIVQPSIQPHLIDAEAVGTCSSSTSSCTYAPNATPKQRAKYVCQVKSGACSPTTACVNAGGVCEMKDDIRGQVDVVGKTCTLEQVPAQSVCRLSQATTSENFDSKIIPAPVNFGSVSGNNNEPEGFLGFAKVF
jgi:hypothetical protein